MAEEIKQEARYTKRLVVVLLALVIVLIVTAVCVKKYIARKKKEADPEEKSIRHAVDEDTVEYETS